MTQADVAERIDELDSHKIGRWERGEQMPGAASRLSLTKVWGSPPWEPAATDTARTEFAAWAGRQAFIDEETRGHVLSAQGLPSAAPVRSPLEPKPRVDLPVLHGGPAAVAPRHLPAGTAHFIGRSMELGQLSKALTGEADPSGRRMITAIDGAAGCGKTELAVHWAHQARAHFPDGDLYVNLRGHEAQGTPLDPQEALSTLLCALNVPSDRIPQGLSEKRGLYRSLLADRRLLIVLDNAASSEQVRPLLPGHGACAVIVTSRNRLSSLAVSEGLHRVTLGLLPQAEAMALFRRVAGADRIDAEPEAAQAIARHCACLPLALRIAADRMVLQPHGSLAMLAEELADVSRRLDALTVWDGVPMQVQAVFSWSYQALSEGARRAFRLLGLTAGPDIGVPAVAALLGDPPGATRQWLAELANVHLLESTGFDRYQAHDLLRAYALERAQAEESVPAREAAIRRWLQWHVCHVDAVGRTLLPNRPRYVVDPASTVTPGLRRFAGEQSANDWLAVERENLIAAVRHAAACAEWRLALDLSILLWDHFAYQNRYWPYMVLVEDVGLNAIEHVRHVQGEAWIIGMRGMRLTDLHGCLVTAATCFERITRLAQSGSEEWLMEVGGSLVDSNFGRAWVLGIAIWGLGEIHRRQGRLGEAQDCFERSLATLQRIGDKWMLVRGLVGMATLFVGRGDGETALKYLREALDLSKATGSRVGELFSLRALADLYRRLGQREMAIDFYTQALEACRRGQDSVNQAGILQQLAPLYLELGRVDQAELCHRQASVLLDVLQLAGLGSRGQTLSPAPESPTLDPPRRVVKPGRRIKS